MGTNIKRKKLNTKVLKYLRKKYGVLEEPAEVGLTGNLTLPEYLYLMRETFEVEHSELAAFLDVSIETLEFWETGKVLCPPFYAFKIAEYLKGPKNTIFKLSVTALLLDFGLVITDDKFFDFIEIKEES